MNYKPASQAPYKIDPGDNVELKHPGVTAAINAMNEFGKAKPIGIYRSKKTVAAELEVLKTEGEESEMDCRGLGHAESVSYWKGYQAGLRASIEALEK